MVKAIIWDYDGTLVDTRHKNMEVTKEIMREILDNSIESYTVLQSLDQYQAANENSENWRELYKHYFKLSDEQIDEAGAMWKEYQLRNDTEVTLFDNVREVLTELSEFRHGIVSQNASENITSYLTRQDLASTFDKVIGYEEISYEQQKPNPAGLFKCINSLVDHYQGAVIYIGDHETDIECVEQAKQYSKGKSSGLRLFSVAALYGLTTSTKKWDYKPDFEISDPKELLSVVRNVAN